MTFSISLFIMPTLLSIFFNLLIIGIVKSLPGNNNIWIIFLSASIDHFYLFAICHSFSWLFAFLVICFILCLILLKILQRLWGLTSFTKECWMLFLQAVDLPQNYLDRFEAWILWWPYSLWSCLKGWGIYQDIVPQTGYNSNISIALCSI